MSRLRKRKEPAASPVTKNTKARQSNPTMTLGIGVAIAVAALLFIFTTGLQSKSKVMVATKAIPAYTTVDPKTMLEEVEVPKQSVTENDLTPELVEKLTAGDKDLVTRAEIQADQRVDQRVLNDGGTALSAVKDDERVVAINTTFAGIAGGAVIPGAVVDVYSNAGASGADEDVQGAVATNVKVLGVGTGGAAAARLRGEANDANVKEGEGSSDIVVLLSVPADKVKDVISAGAVAMSLNTKMSFEPNGDLCDIEKCLGSSSAKGSADADAASTPDPAEEPTGTTTETTPAGEDELPASPIEEGAAPAPGE